MKLINTTVSMKKITLLTALLIGMFAFSQTSMTEYNYLSKGYLLDKQTGRDLKDGYRMDLVTNTVSQILNDGSNSINRMITVYKFVRVKDEKAVALLIIEKREDTNFESYICVPSPKSVSAVRNIASKDFFSRIENKESSTLAAYHYYWLALQVLAETNTN